jgi:uncharacterized NAD-dependent epimerase/dehydratase family protein
MEVLGKPYLLFLGDAHDQLAAKTADGIAEWRPEWCVGQFRLPGCVADVGLEDVTIEEAARRGAKTMVLGVVNSGGFMPESWTESLTDALARGMDLASGMHVRLEDFPEVAEAARAHGRKLVDVRHSAQKFSTGKGKRRSGKRLLTVGTDCSCGKKYTALAIERSLRQRGVAADFCATGQTGVLIAERGVAIDAVIADFISGAAEWLTPDNEPDHWDVVEGQGSLFHPAFAGVTLGLLHGAQADALVLCHEPTRTHVRGLPHAPMPDVGEAIEAYVGSGRLTNPDCRMVAISVNTAALGEAEARDCLGELGARHDLPTTDPLRFGVEAIVDALG